MKYKFKWYLNDNCESPEVPEQLEHSHSRGKSDEIPNLWINKEEYEPNWDIVNAIMDIFYEVEFDCEYDDEKKKVRIIAVDGHELFFRPSV